MKNQMNALPVPTWHHLGVNEAPAKTALPALPDEGWGTPSLTCEIPGGVRSLSVLPEQTAFPESALGAAADGRILNEANDTRIYEVSTPVSAPMVFRYRADGRPLLASLTLLIRAGASVTVIQASEGIDGSDAPQAVLTRILAEDGASVRLIQTQLLGRDTARWNTVAATLAADASLDIVRVEFGGHQVLSGSRVILEGHRSRFSLHAAYIGGEDDVLDFNDVAVHLGRDTRSEIHSAGVLAGHAEKILRGTIDFRRGAVRGIGHESEDVLLFSPTVRNRTAPLILCAEEQVEGQHAASAGRLDEKILYYLASRGIDEKKARRLLVEAKFAPVIDDVPEGDFRESVRETLERRLDTFEQTNC